MKKNYLLWSLALAVLMAVCSCSSNSKSNGLLSLIPADAEYVLVANPRVIVESAGGSLTDTELALPSWLEELDAVDDDDVEKANEKLKEMGISTESVAVAVSISGKYSIVLLSLTDQDKFAKYVKDEMEYDNETKDDGLAIYTRDGDKDECVAISGSHAYLFNNINGGNNNAKRTIKAFIADAKEASYDKSPVAKYIVEGNACGSAIKITKSMIESYSNANPPASAKKIIGSYFCSKWSVSEDKLTAEIKAFDQDGNVLDTKELEQYLDVKSKVSKEALAYLGKNESLVAAISLKDVDWDEYTGMVASAAGMSRSERQSLSAVTDYLENIDGTIAIGLGLTNGLKSIANIDRGKDVMRQFDATIVIETKDGKAAKLMADLEDLLSSLGIPYQGSASKGLSISYEGLTVYVAAKGDLLIASNHKIEKKSANPTVKAFDFTSYIGAIAIALDKDNQLAKDLGIDSDVCLSYAADADNVCVKFELEIKGGQGKGVLEKLGNICVEVSKQEDSPISPAIEYHRNHDWSSVEDADAVRQSTWLKRLTK